MASFLLRIVGILLMLTALAVALSRAPDRPVETLVARWAPPPSDFIDVGGQLVHLRDEGPRNDPLPVLLIHGTGASLHTWEPWVAQLKKQRRIITFDLPAFGLTGPFTGARAAVPEERRYHGDTYARFVFDLLDKLQVPRVVVGGNSLGGEVAWRMATLAPERVASLILVDASGIPFVPEQVPIGFLIARTPVANRVAEWLLPRSLVTQSIESVYGDKSRITDALIDRYFELTLREGNRRALGERLRHLERSGGEERIATIRQPTLVLWGGRDRLIPPAIGRQFAERITGSKLVVFDTLGHVPHEEDPAATLVPVREFLGLR